MGRERERRAKGALQGRPHLAKSRRLDNIECRSSSQSRVVHFMFCFSLSVWIVQRHLHNLHPNQPPVFRPGRNLVPVFHPETSSVCQQGVSVVPPVPRPLPLNTSSLFMPCVYRQHVLRLLICIRGLTTC